MLSVSLWSSPCPVSAIFFGSPRSAAAEVLLGIGAGAASVLWLEELLNFVRRRLPGKPIP